jgi:hypothetical protein
MNAKQFKEISEWQAATFGQATPLSKIAHLEKEVKELKDDLVAKNPDRRLEFADCILLLFGSAASDGMSYQDIENAIDEKMAINYARKWGKPDKDGVVHHIPEDPS